MKNKYEKEAFSAVIKNSINYTDVCRNLDIGLSKGNRDTIKKYIKEYELNIDHFYIPHNVNLRHKIELNEILIENSKYIHTTSIKNKLYKEGLKERKCEYNDCGQVEEWRGQKISLILDHINGINNDNRLENLRIICPNCNASLPTHGGKNKNSFKIDDDKILKNKQLKKSLEKERLENNGKTLKQIESNLNQRKVERPRLEILLNDVKELGYRETGRKYGVSDNSIRKWIK